jgi:hypothetical protein
MDPNDRSSSPNATEAPSAETVPASTTSSPSATPAHIIAWAGKTPIYQPERQLTPRPSLKIKPPLRPALRPADPSRVSFNPEAFRHLTDMILQHLRGEELLTLRHVCAYVREVAESRLVRLVDLNSEDNPFRTHPPVDLWDSSSITAGTMSVLSFSVFGKFGTQPTLENPPNLPNIHIIRDNGKSPYDAAGYAPRATEWVKIYNPCDSRKIPNVVEERIVISVNRNPPACSLDILPPSPLEVVIILDRLWQPEIRHQCTCPPWDEDEDFFWAYGDCLSDCEGDLDSCLSCQLQYDNELAKTGSWVADSCDIIAERILAFRAPNGGTTVTLVGWEGVLDLTEIDEEELCHMVEGRLHVLRLDFQRGDVVEGLEGLKSAYDKLKEGEGGWRWEQIDLGDHLRFETIGQYKQRIGDVRYKLHTHRLPNWL